VTLLNNLLAWFVYESSLRYPKPEAQGGETASNAGKKKQRAIFHLMDESQSIKTLASLLCHAIVNNWWLESPGCVRRKAKQRPS
jgi:hypothetical protein